MIVTRSEPGKVLELREGFPADDVGDPGCLSWLLGLVLVSVLLLWAFGTITPPTWLVLTLGVLLILALAIQTVSHSYPCTQFTCDGEARQTTAVLRRSWGRTETRTWKHADLRSLTIYSSSREQHQLPVTLEIVSAAPSPTRPPWALRLWREVRSLFVYSPPKRHSHSRVSIELPIDWLLANQLLELGVTLAHLMDLPGVVRRVSDDELDDGDDATVTDALVAEAMDSDEMIDAGSDLPKPRGSEVKENSATITPTDSAPGPGGHAAAAHPESFAPNPLDPPSDAETVRAVIEFLGVRGPYRFEPSHVDERPQTPWFTRDTQLANLQPEPVLTPSENPVASRSRFKTRPGPLVGFVFPILLLATLIATAADDGLRWHHLGLVPVLCVTFIQTARSWLGGAAWKTIVDADRRELCIKQGHKTTVTPFDHARRLVLDRDGAVLELDSATLRLREFPSGDKAIAVAAELARTIGIPLYRDHRESPDRAVDTPRREARV